ncbi:uncharacterized protein RAG0_12926 [Rhynchosporium agropyri]|uniref:Uncharacterized protein n=2 Tax=Rhynchosporium TaxID=38037 RepID=A0A1E1LAF8_9HELO|nr:uncharacterized protein RAG0_12926 [Rhynchosporium agropyri]CZT09445.1 uncharacterized protein RCO7_15025 [Rhynchosporium commune]
MAEGTRLGKLSQAKQLSLKLLCTYHQITTFARRLDIFVDQLVTFNISLQQFRDFASVHGLIPAKISPDGFDKSDFLYLTS